MKKDKSIENKKSLATTIKSFFGLGRGRVDYYSDGRIIEEPFTGAWQHNIYAKTRNVDENFAYFSCVNLTAKDIAKCDIDVKVRDEKSNVWTLSYDSKYRYLTKLTERPNHFQTHFDFFSNWVYSLQRKGNAFVFIDWLGDPWDGGEPMEMYVLDPEKVQILKSPDGSVWYKFENEKGESHTYSNDQIIHSRINAMFDPLVGVPPIFAASIHARNSIEKNETQFDFYQNAARPSGLLIAPHDIDQEQVDALKKDLVEAMSGRQNAGKMFVISGGVQYQQMGISAQDQQLLESLKFDTDAICACFHIPSYMIMGNAPSYNNIEALQQEYFQRALHFIFKIIEENLHRGLKLDDDVWLEFNMSNLLRMDKKTRFQVHGQAIKDGWMTINEVRANEDLAPMEGGDDLYRQMQDLKLNEEPINENNNNNDEVNNDDEVENNEKALELLNYITKGFKIDSKNQSEKIK